MHDIPDSFLDSRDGFLCMYQCVDAIGAYQGALVHYTFVFLGFWQKFGKADLPEFICCRFLVVSLMSFVMTGSS